MVPAVLDVLTTTDVHLSGFSIDDPVDSLHKITATSIPPDAGVRQPLLRVLRGS